MVEPYRGLQWLRSITQCCLKVDQSRHFVGLACRCHDGCSGAIDKGICLPIVRILIGGRGVHHDLRSELREQLIDYTAIDNRILYQCEVGVRIKIVAAACCEIVDREYIVAASKE